MINIRRFGTAKHLSHNMKLNGWLYLYFQDAKHYKTIQLILTFGSAKHTGANFLFELAMNFKDLK